MTEEQLIRKIEWADKRCSLKGEPFTETQKDYLKFVFAGMTSEKSDFIGHVVGSYSLKVGDKIKMPSGLEAEVIKTKVKVKDDFGGEYYLSDIEVG